MAKQQHESLRCSECEYRSLKWLGQCPHCKAWDSFITQEETPMYHQPLRKNGSAGYVKTSNANCTFTTLQNIPISGQERLKSGINEWDRVCGGGLMPGSLCMLTGDPGIGKSTLLLQIAFSLGTTRTVFYVSTEESLSQVKQRANRLADRIEGVHFTDTTNLDTVINTVAEKKPDLLIIDSLSNCTLTDHLPGSIAHLKEATFRLMHLAKQENITIILSGHITKEGVMAGPKMIEHMVDAVFYLQGDDRLQVRILRSLKNRFGTVNEVGFFEMNETGMHAVANVNSDLLAQVHPAPGTIISSTLEGSRPILLEMQALTVPTKYSTPQRVVSGVEYNQVALLAAMLSKYLKLKLNEHDIFFKISGGVRSKSSTNDLAIALALYSSYRQETLPAKTVALAEISLNGFIKPIHQCNIYLQELEKYSIKQLIVSKHQKLPPQCKLPITAIESIYELPGLL